MTVVCTWATGSRRGNQIMTRAAGIAIAGVVAVLGMATASHAWDDRVVANCTDDYFAYCSAHGPETQELRSCMESNRTRLSKQCVKALLDAGEVPKKYLSSNTDQKK